MTVELRRTQREAVMQVASTAMARIVVLGVVIALYYYVVVSAIGSGGGADADIGAGLVGFAGLVLLSFGWAFLDGRAGRTRHVVVSWSVAAATLAIGWRIVVSVAEADASLGVAEVFVADLSLVLFLFALMAVPASLGALAGAAFRGDHPSTADTRSEP